jgi:hypothetical protein
MVSRMSMIPEAVRRAALYTPSDLPDPPPEHPYTVLRRDGYAIGFMAGQSWGSVVTESVDDVEGALADAREVLRQDGKVCAAWTVTESTMPAGLKQRLLELGLTVWDEPPFEPRAAVMALVDEPESAPGVETRLAETFEEYRAASRVAEDAFEMPEDMRIAYREQERRLWEMEQRHPAFRTYVAFVDGEVAAGAAIIYGRNAAFLAGGFTRPTCAVAASTVRSSARAGTRRSRTARRP